jgi:hypothetical protein
MWAIRPRLVMTPRVRWIDNFRNLVSGCSAGFADRIAARIGLGIALVERHPFLPGPLRIKIIAKGSEDLYP